MNPEVVFASAEYVEYAVIGAHASLWLLVLFSWLFNLHLSQISQINVVFLLVLVPITIVMGTTIDGLTQRVLSFPRKAIKRLAGKDVMKDEMIGRLDPVLYAAYEWRIRRARIPGAAIFNWL